MINLEALTIGNKYDRPTLARLWGYIDLWKTCSVTGFSKEKILIASHIKPWKLSNNEDIYNQVELLLKK